LKKGGLDHAVIHDLLCTHVGLLIETPFSRSVSVCTQSKFLLVILISWFFINESILFHGGLPVYLSQQKVILLPSNFKLSNFYSMRLVSISVER